jgi:hypothetical protein
MPQPSSTTSTRSIPPRRKADLDPSRARVDRVLDQLLQRAGRALHHLAGGDPVNQMVGKAAY